MRYAPLLAIALCMVIVFAVGFIMGDSYHHRVPEGAEWDAAPCSCFDVGNPDCFV